MHTFAFAGAIAGLAAQATAEKVNLGLNLWKGIPDRAPVPAAEQWTSPIVLPSPNVSGDADWATAVKKARAFTAKLTLDEKVNMTTGVDRLGRCVGNTGDITRLGIAGFCLNDSPLGVRFADKVSAFPAAINGAASFDVNLIYQRAVAMGAEFRGKGVNVALGPMMNLGRVAAGGRNWEGWGGDPYLAGIASAQTVKGIQSQGVIACAKHYVGNEQEHYRGGGGGTAESSNIDDRTMHELYHWPFAESVHAGVGSVMCSYNRINQTYACENSKTINGLMKEELDFQGFMLSDWAGIESGVGSALAGTDMNMPGFYAYTGAPDQGDPANANNSWWGAALREAVNNGSVPMWRLDDMVTRTFAAWYKMGQDKGYPATNFNYSGASAPGNEHVNVQGDHYKIIREIGGASTVLLKNTDSTLPLTATNIKQIAIIGNDAGPNPKGANSCGDRACDIGTLAMGWGSGTTNFPYLVDPNSALLDYIHSASPDTDIQSVLNDTDYDAVRAVAANSDVCLVFTSADSGEGYLNVEGNQGDRKDLHLWHNGTKLIHATAAACENTIVVMHNVGPINMEGFVNNKNVKAILAAGIPGQETGNAIVDVLFGAVNPSARLPYTIAKKRSDYPADVLYTSDAAVPQITYTEKLNIDYRHFDAEGIQPRFEFGFGLSYTTFKYSGLEIQTASSAKKRRIDAEENGVPMMAARDSAWSDDFPVLESRSGTPGGPSSLWENVYSVSAVVANTGSYDGHEVPQLYLGFPAGSGEPPRVLRGFSRVLLPKGASDRVSFNLRRKDISIWDVVSQSWVVPKGTFTVYVGASSRDIRLQGKFTP